MDVGLVLGHIGHISWASLHVGPDGRLRSGSMSDVIGYCKSHIGYLSHWSYFFIFSSVFPCVAVEMVCWKK